ncbi:MAG: cytochrome c oxidase subunit 3 [Crocinitomicaceae bacterium]|nr:cytochrome c oxidase subunit 3 [Crocinitomicaceae bacterium]
MRQEFEQELSPEIREKLRKNLVYAAIGSIIMVFAGLISAYIVSMGDAFWLKGPLPMPFYVSTVLILISSVTFSLSVKVAKAQNKKMLMLFISITFLLGIGFIYSQFQGYKQLVDRGFYAGSSRILVSDGRYGDFYTLKYKGKFLIVDGNDYLIDGKIIDSATKSSIQAFGKQLEKADAKNGINNLTGYGTDFVLYFESEPLAYLDNKLTLPDGTVVGDHDLYRLRKWAEHIRDGRGDFFAKGKYGEDFVVYYKSVPLNYKDRTFYKGDQKLSPYLINKSMDSADTASSYIYVITFLHLLHIIATLLFMIRTVTFSFLGKYTNGDTIGLKATGIFWHFLDILWLFLLLFLLFIH